MDGGSTARAQAPRLVVRRIFDAPRAQVFAAWTEEARLKQWFAPGDVAVAAAEVDARAGGAYRVHMRESSGKEHRVIGAYTEVDPPRRLVFTWHWETDPAEYETLVTVEFIDRGDRTEVVLTHEGFRTEQERNGHEEGWASCLENLNRVV